MNYALSVLEARHHRKELAIMERMEQLEPGGSCSWSSAGRRFVRYKLISRDWRYRN